MDKTFEQEYLNIVINHIDTKIEDCIEKIQKFNTNLREENKRIWEDINFSTDTDVVVQNYNNYLAISEKEYELDSIIENYNILKKLKNSAYFARIDFIEDGESNKESFYFGISTLIDKKSRKYYIYDWRSPIASLFYENEIGEAYYDCPAGKIKGEITKKRQYKVRNNEIIYMFDNNINIDDSILQELFFKSKDNKMRNIIVSIQKKQNEIIRNEKNQILIVQGSSGSGKTSIALHRIAYLLYKGKNKGLTSKNIIIFSPNKIFNEYISSVLPELGEQNVKQSTFKNFISDFIELDKYNVEAYYEQFESILNRNISEIKVENIKFKTSIEFSKILTRFVSYIDEKKCCFKDIFYNDKCIIQKEEIEELYNSSYKHMPIILRNKKIQERIEFLLNEIEKKVIKEKIENADRSSNTLNIASWARLEAYKEFKLIRNDLEDMLNIDVFKLYSMIFTDAEFLNILKEENINIDQALIEFTVKSIKEHNITYEDLIGYLYIKIKLGDKINMSSFKYVVIDEAQDYSYIQFMIFNELFKTSQITILGDFNQSIHPYICKTYNEIVDIFNKDVINLNINKSYRSSKEIVQFTNNILVNEKVEYIDKEGPIPETILCISIDDEVNRIKDSLMKNSNNYNSIGVICKNKRDTEFVYSKLSNIFKVNLIKSENGFFEKGINIITSYLAKGLEFEMVIVYEAGENNYCNEDERYLFYTICTRATSKLDIYYTGNSNKFILS